MIKIASIEDTTRLFNSLIQLCGGEDTVILIFPLCFSLQKLFVWLIDVDQSPHESMQTALSPLMKALVAGKLFKHSDDDVRVAVAACISEITRITAPEAPYDDDQMKVLS